MSIICFLADALTATTHPTQTGDADKPWYAQIFLSPTFPLILGGIFLFLIMSRSKKGGDKERLASLKNLKRGDRVQTIGGILGSVLRTEENRVEVKVDETNNTKMWFTRNAIHRVVEEDKADLKQS